MQGWCEQALRSVELFVNGGGADPSQNAQLRSSQEALCLVAGSSQGHTDAAEVKQRWSRRSCNSPQRDLKI